MARASLISWRRRSTWAECLALGRALQDLEGHFLVQLAIPRAEHHTHPALAQFGEKFVTAGER